MKKILIVIIFCLMFTGCGTKKTSLSYDEPVYNETIKYYNGDILLNITYTDDVPDGFEFQFELNGYGLGEFAYYEDDAHQSAIGQENEDGHAYHFTFKKNKVIVQESKGQNSLGIQLSGEYIKK